MKQQIDGIIVLNKPSGISSNSASNKVKWIINANKAGHLGTLDPLATGVLPVALGKATKYFDRFLKKTKTYIATFLFGKETDTLDSEGVITNTSECDIDVKTVEKLLPRFIGKIDQMPPKYSAKKIKGRKAYVLARAGIEFELKPKTIEIFDIKLLSQLEKNIFQFEITCSSGTYIRSIARDLALDLGTYGIMTALIRTRCGVFSIENSFTFDNIENGKYRLITLDEINNLLGDKNE